MYALNHVPVIDLTKSQTGCCTLINPKDWDEQTFVFDSKLFVKARVRSFFHMPLNMASVMRKTQEKIVDAGADTEEFFVLSYEVSPWSSEQYFAVSKPVPDLDVEKISGTFVTKVFEGPYKDAHKWYVQLIKYVKSLRKKPLKTFFFYTACPSCSKIYGKNYVVGFEQVA